MRPSYFLNNSSRRCLVTLNRFSGSLEPMLTTITENPFLVAVVVIDAPLDSLVPVFNPVTPSYSNKRPGSK